MKLCYKVKTATQKEIYLHLKDCNDSFKPPLNTRVNLQDFSKKIFEKSVSFETWENQILVGIISAYFNDIENRSGYINNVSITKNYRGMGIATTLLKMCIEYARQYNFSEIKLEVSKYNFRAIQLYRKLGFHDFENRGDFILMRYEVDFTNTK